MNKKEKTVVITLNILFLIFFISVFCFVLLFVNSTLIKTIQQNKTKLLKMIEDKTGYILTYKSISPNFITSLEINGVEIKNKNDNKKIIVGNVKVNYSIISYLKDTKNPIDIIKKIEVKRLHLNTSKNQIETLTKLFNNKKSGNGLKINNLAINIINSNLDLSLDADKKLHIYANHIKVNIKNKKVSFKTSLQTNLYVNDKTIGKLTINTGGDLNTAKGDLKSDIKLILSNIQIGENRISDQKFNITSNNQDFIIKRVKDTLPLIFSVVKNNDEITLFLKAKQLNINNILTISSKTNLPEILNTDIAINYKISDKTISSRCFGNIIFSKMLLIGKSSLIYDFKIDKEKIHIDKIELKSFINNGTLSITGDYNYKNRVPTLTFITDKLKILSSEISSMVVLNNGDNKINLFSEYFVVNKANFENFSYSLKKVNNKHLIETTSPFNGVYLSNDLTDDRDSFNIKLDSFKLTPFLPDSAKMFFKNIKISTDIVLKKINGLYHTGLCPTSIVSDNSKLLSLFFQVNGKMVKISDLTFANGKISDINANITPLQKDNGYFINIFNEKGSFPLSIALNKDLLSLTSNKDLAFIYYNSGFIKFNLTNFSLPFYDNSPVFNASINSNIKNKTVYNSSLNISNIQGFQKRNANIKCKIDLGNNILNITDLIYNDNDNLIKGNLTGNIINTSNKPVIEGTSLLTDNNKNESYSFNFKIDEGMINSRLFITNMDIKKIAGDNLKGIINIRSVIKGKLSNPDITFEGDTKNCFYKKKKFKGLFIIRKIDKTIKIENLITELDNKIRLQISKSSFDLTKNGVENILLNGDFYAEIIAKKIKSTFNIEGGVKNKDNFDFKVNFVKSSIGYMKSGKIIRFDRADNVKIGISRNPEKLLIETLNSNILRLTILKNGLFGNLFIDNKRALSTNISFDNDKNLKGIIELYDFNIKPFNIITLPIVEFYDGYLNGKMNISGKIDDPEIYGKLLLNEGKITLPDYLVKPISNISGIINGNGKKLKVINVSGYSGGGLVNGYGEVSFLKNRFDGYSFIVSSDLVPAKFKYGPVDIVGNGIVENFLLEGAPKSYLFKGDIFIDQANINITNFSNATYNPDKSTIPIFANLNFTTGKKVDVNYPLISGTIAADNKLSLNYSSVDNSLNFLGKIDFKSGKINFLNKIFKIEEARINFDNGPEGNNPLVNLSSYYTTKDNEKNKVKIYLNITDRLFSFKTNFSSQPHLSDVEINQLLGLSLKDNETLSDEKDTTTASSMDSILNTTNYLGNTFILSPFENTIKKSLNLDTFSLDSYIFSNILTSDKSLLDLLDKSSLSIGKYIVDGFYLESLMTFNKNSDINGKQFVPIPKTDYGFNLQLQVMFELPFISLGYTYIPVDYKDFSNSEQKITIETGFKF